MYCGLDSKHPISELWVSFRERDIKTNEIIKSNCGKRLIDTNKQLGVHSGNTKETLILE